MEIRDFKLERYFAKHEFTAKYLLSCSDCDGFELSYVLEQASGRELEMWEGLRLGYTESAGHPLLREAILQYYEIDSIDNIVVGTPGELNFISMNLLLNSGDHVISVAPAYQSLYEIVRSLNCELSFWKPDRENWEFDIMDLKGLIKENTKLIIINFPHNPTGAYLSLSQLEEIVNIARDRDIYIYSDEMYHKLILGDTQELPPLCDIYEKGISLWGTSKSFGLAGLRTGWIICRNKSFLNKVVAFKDYLSICNSAPSEILSIIALNNIDKFIKINVDKIKRNIGYFQEFLKTSNLFSSFIMPKAGSVSFAELDIEETALEFSNKLVKEAGIMTVPGEMFEYEGKFIRIGFGRKNFPEVLRVLSDYLSSIANRF